MSLSYKLVKRYLSVCQCVCASVWLLTRMAKIVTAANRACNLACTDLLMNPDHTTCVKKVNWVFTSANEILRPICVLYDYGHQMHIVCVPDMCVSLIWGKM